MINLELPKSITSRQPLLRKFAQDGFRPISRKYDELEQQEMPEELYALSELLTAGKKDGKAKDKPADTPQGNVNGGNLSQVNAIEQLCWGDVGLLAAMPTIGLGNAAIDAVASDEQKAEWGELFASMAITEPSCGSDSAAIKTTATLDGDEWVLNGEKIFVTDGFRSKQVVLWATLDRSLGKAAIKSFLVPKGTPGMTVVRTEKKLGLRTSDTAQIIFDNCRIPKGNILGNPEIAKNAEERKKAFGGVMQTFDNTRPIVAAQALGVARAALDMTQELVAQKGLQLDYSKGYWELGAVENDLIEMEADLESARLLVQKAAWMADNKQANSKNASMSKAKAGKVGNAVSLKCVEICGQLGYSKVELLEKFARDSKIIDIYEGTQQVQQLILARQILGKGSSELK